MKLGISVVIPVGPYSTDWQWLDECLQSVRAQTYRANEILLIDDMAGLDSKAGEEGMSRVIGDRFCGGRFQGCRVWRSPWRLGVAAAMNFGVALAENDLVFMLCADDMLHPECLERCLDAYGQMDAEIRDKSYYFVGVRYLDDRQENEQFLACGAAMVTKELWRICGGFAPETASGAPDAALISVMMVHPEAGRIIGVGRGMCLYNYRPHKDSDSARRAGWQGVILSTRDILTRDWQVPRWGRAS